MALQYDSAIIGFGETGASCARYLAGQGERLLIVDFCAQPAAVDSLKELDLTQVTLSFGDFDLASVLQAKRLIFSPGVDRNQPPFNMPRLRALPTTGDIQLFSDARRARKTPGMLSAVTGSNGKSTVVDLIRCLLSASGLKVAVGGNFGTAALNLLQPGTDYDCWLLELSSFQLDLVSSIAPDLALILNIGDDHRDRHASMEQYAACKRKIFIDAAACIWNRNDPDTAPPEHYQGRRISIGLDAPTEPDDFGCITTGQGRHLVQGSSWQFPVSALPLLGRHNEINALFAVAAAWLAGGRLSDFARPLTEYKSLPHRCQPLALVDGIHFLDDSKATNVDAACAALKSWSTPDQNNILLLAGGKDKQADLKPLAEIASGRVRMAAFFGEVAAVLDDLFKTVCPNISRIKAECLEAAFTALMPAAKPNDVVLLSPACASQDEFRDFRARGHAFAALVERWVQARAAP